MSTSALYADIALPAAGWYEMHDLNTTDMHPFIHPFNPAIDPPWESRTNWEQFKTIAKRFSELAGNHLHLNIARNAQRIWSPHLNLEIVGDEEKATILGHFGPRPDIWSLAIGLYCISIFVGSMGLLFAASQWMLGMSLCSLWFVVGSVILGLAVYILAE